MAYSHTQYVVGENASAGQVLYDLSFEGPDDGYLERTHIWLYLNGTERGGAGGVDADGFSWVTNTRVQLKDYSPVEGDVLDFRRIIPKTDNYVDFTGGFIHPDVLDDQNLSLLYLVHEIHDGFVENFDEYEDDLADLVAAAAAYASAASDSADAAAASAVEADGYADDADASATAAAASAVSASGFADDAEDWSDKAELWAEEDYGTEVETGMYSAKHWATVAAAVTANNGNHLINGDFQVWERAYTQTTSGYGSCDRWINAHATSTKQTTRRAFSVGQTDVYGNPTYYCETAVTTGGTASSNTNQVQRIEDVTRYASKTMTFSFYAAADSASLDLAVEIRQIFGSGGSSAVICHIEKVDLTTSWTKYTMEVTLPSISGKTIGTDSYLQVRFWFDAGSDYDAYTDTLGNQSGEFYLAMIKLEDGSEATPLESRTYQLEKFLCERYYYVGVDTTSIEYVGNGYNNNTTNGRGILELGNIQRMRTLPTITLTGTLQMLVRNTYYAVTSQTLVVASNGRAQYNVNTAGTFTQGEGHVLVTQGSATQTRLDFDAEI